MPVGNGFDLHRLVPGRPLILGGVSVEHALGLLGHSDGDVVCHAVIDALLGAAGRGDIGQRFPCNEEKWKDANSLALLKVVGEELKPWTIVNIDITILAEVPRLTPYREPMQENIAGALGIEKGQVNIKAKTMEGLGAIGSREAIAAMVTTQLEK